MKKKIIFIDQVSDKILNLIQEVEKIEVNQKIFIYFLSILEKKSKLRIFLKNQKNIIIVPCYEDNEINT